MYGRFKRRRSSKGGSRASKRRKSGGSSRAKRFLPTSRGDRLLANPATRASGETRVNRPGLYVQRSHTWFPERMRIPLKYTLQYTNSTVAGIGFQLSLKANNINDPGGAGAANQPYGFDIIKLVYNNFVVLGASLRVAANVISSGTTSYATCLNDFVIWPAGNNTSYVNDAEGAKQHPGAKWLTGNFNGNFTSDCFPTIRNYQSTAKMVGRTTSQILADSSYHGGISGTDPTLLWDWNILLAPQGAVAGNANQYVLQIEMIMYTEVYGLASLAST